MSKEISSWLELESGRMLHAMLVKFEGNVNGDTLLTLKLTRPEQIKTFKDNLLLGECVIMTTDACYSTKLCADLSRLNRAIYELQRARRLFAPVGLQNPASKNGTIQWIEETKWVETAFDAPEDVSGKEPMANDRQ